MKQYTKRLKDGEDLRKGIQNLAKEHNVKAAVLASVVGSLKKTHLRTPVVDPKKVVFKNTDVPVEIVSGTGTLSADDLHIHLSVSDSKGKTFGGHLSHGNIVRTTAEVVILAFDDVEYKRLPDEKTGYEELVIE